MAFFICPWQLSMGWGDETTRGKYFAGLEGIRMEGVSDGESYLMIVNFARNVSWMVQVQERTYFELPFDPEDANLFLREP